MPVPTSPACRLNTRSSNEGMNEPGGGRRASSKLSLRASRCGARTRAVAVPIQPPGGPHGRPCTLPYKEAVLPGECTGNPAPRQSRGSALPQPAEPQRSHPSHLVSKYTLGGCQESGGIAAIAQRTESCSKATSGVGSRVPCAAARTSGLRRSTFAMPRFGKLRQG